MHFVQAKGILSARNSVNGMNLYRGCQHGCIYCDSRSKCYHIEHDFEDIEVKENAIELLEAALSKKRKCCMIGTGAMTDPYTPVEASLCMTQRALEVIEKHGFGISIQTKSKLILRDLDLLKRINDKTKAVVQITLTTFDDKLCRIVEPGVCVTSERFQVLKQMQAAGIPTVVWLCPILPFINDTQENINGILDYCEAAGVRGIINFGMGVTLRDGDREYFYAALDRHFPGLKAEYIRRYGLVYQLDSPRAGELRRIFNERCRKAGFLVDQDVFRYMNEFEEKVPLQGELF